MSLNKISSRLTPYRFWCLVWLLCLLILALIRWHFGAVVEKEGGLIESFEVFLIAMIMLAAFWAASLTPYPKNLVWFFLVWLFFIVLMRELNNQDWQLPELMLNIATQSEWRFYMTLLGSSLILIAIFRNFLLIWSCRQRFFTSDLPLFGVISAVFSLVFGRFFEINIFEISTAIFFEEMSELTGYFCALLGVWSHRTLFVSSDSVE